MFNQLVMLNEQLVAGREDIFFGFEFDIFAAKELPGPCRLALHRHSPRALRPAHQLRALSGVRTTMAQNKQRAAQRLALPVLAIGGALNLGEQVAGAMKMAADDVQSLVIPGSGHWVAEEAPEETVAALTAFLTS